MKFSYKNTAKVEEHEITTLGGILAGYISKLSEISKKNDYADYEGSINLPFDNEMVAHVSGLAGSLVTKRLKYIVVVGIGGSNLGSKAVYDALYGTFDILEPERFPKIIFADTNDPHFVQATKNLLSTLGNPDEVIFNVISKSGKTTETLANLEMLLPKGPHFRKRLVITTDFKSDLWHSAEEMGVETLPIPEKVGGRYSVFSAVGLFPLACAGVDITALLEGAMEIRKTCLSPTLLENPAALSAIILFSSYRAGYKIHDTFLFHPELESLGKWYRQLMGESIGKDHVGITPTVSIGSTDLHSLGQLYLGGPRDKFFTFVSTKTHSRHATIPNDVPFPLLLADLSDKEAYEIMEAIIGGVTLAYEKAGVPFIEIELDSVDEKSLGKFMQFKMIEMMYLGQLFGVNAFDQPDVEKYKEETRKILGDM